MSKWICEVCGKKIRTKHELVDHLKAEIEQYDYERQQCETAEDQLYELTGEVG